MIHALSDGSGELLRAGVGGSGGQGGVMVG